MTKKYLIICTYRTGSTLLCDLLQKKTGFIDYGECLSIQDPPAISTQQIKKLMTSESGRDLITFNSEIEHRINVLNNSEGWIVKLIAIPGMIPTKFIQQCINDTSTEVIFLYRKNIEQQFESEVNNSYRNALRGPSQNHFRDMQPFIKYDAVDLPKRTIKNLVLMHTQRLQTWRLLYDVYGKHCKLVCYEDNLLNFNLEHLGIESNNSSYIKTPYTTTKLVNGNWQNYVDFLQQYKYLIDL